MQKLIHLSYILEEGLNLVLFKTSSITFGTSLLHNFRTITFFLIFLSKKKVTQKQELLSLFPNAKHTLQYDYFIIYLNIIN